jgi:hypothetical protein
MMTKLLGIQGDAYDEKTKKRLLSKVTMTDSGCWILTRSIKKMKRGNGGYGEVGYRGRTVQAHRLMYGLCYGEPPLDKCVMHECDVRPCIRPEHLKLGTHHDNMLDMCRKGRLKIRSGEACHFAKLTAYDIREIRELYATGMLSTSALAEMFRVTPGLISHIVNHRHWRRGDADKQIAQPISNHHPVTVVPFQNCA